MRSRFVPAEPRGRVTAAAALNPFDPTAGAKPQGTLDEPVVVDAEPTQQAAEPGGALIVIPRRHAPRPYCNLLWAGILPQNERRCR